MYQDDEELIYDSFVAFAQCISIAIEKESHIVAGGDIIECNYADYPMPIVLSFLAKQLKRLEEANLKFYYINGQHDRKRNNLSFPESINSRVAVNIHLKEVNISGINVVGIDSVNSHHLPAHLEAAADLTKDPNCLLLTHQRWKQFLNFKNSYDASFDIVPHKFHTMITGDMHTAKLVRFNSTNEEKARAVPLRVLSPGATCRRTSREPDKHYCWLVSLTGNKFDFKKFKLFTRLAERFELNDIDDFDLLVGTYQKIIEKLKPKIEKLPPRIAKPVAFLSGTATGDVFRAASELLSPYFHVRSTGREVRNTIDTPELFETTEKTYSPLSVVSLVDKVTDDSKVQSFIRGGLQHRNFDDFLNRWEKNENQNRNAK
jgi:hypothetical protein